METLLIVFAICVGTVIAVFETLRRTDLDKEQHLRQGVLVGLSRALEIAKAESSETATISAIERALQDEQAALIGFGYRNGRQNLFSSSASPASSARP